MQTGDLITPEDADILRDPPSRRYITSLVVQKEQARALADAIAALPLAAFQVALAIHCDQTGEGVDGVGAVSREGSA